MDELTVLEDESIFTIEQLATRPYERDKIVQMDVTVEMNLDL